MSMCLMLLADDSKTYQELEEDASHHPANQQALQERVDRIAQWAEDWQMEINPSNSKIMHVGRKNPGLPYTINGTPIESNNGERYRLLDIK